MEPVKHDTMYYITQIQKAMAGDEALTPEEGVSMVEALVMCMLGLVGSVSHQQAALPETRLIKFDEGMQLLIKMMTIHTATTRQALANGVFAKPSTGIITSL